MKLVGHIFFLYLIIWCQVLNQPKCIFVLFRRIIIRGCCQALSFIFQDGLWDQWKIWQILLLKCATEHLCWAYYFVTVTTRWSLKEQFCDKWSSTQGINSFWKGHPWGNRQLRELPSFSSMSVCFDSFSCSFFFLWLLVLLPFTCSSPPSVLCIQVFPWFHPVYKGLGLRGCSPGKYSSLRRRSCAGPSPLQLFLVGIPHHFSSSLLVAFSPVHWLLLMPLVSLSF